jgi:hypothetical protein
MCSHLPPCPAAENPDRTAARITANHAEQGWALLCNGVVLFDDTGQLLPDRRVIAPHRPCHARSYRQADIAATIGTGRHRFGSALANTLGPLARSY